MPEGQGFSFSISLSPSLLLSLPPSLLTTVGSHLVGKKRSILGMKLLLRKTVSLFILRVKELSAKGQIVKTLVLLT